MRTNNLFIWRVENNLAFESEDPPLIKTIGKISTSKLNKGWLSIWRLRSCRWIRASDSHIAQRVEYSGRLPIRIMARIPWGVYWRDRHQQQQQYQTQWKVEATGEKDKLKPGDFKSLLQMETTINTIGHRKYILSSPGWKSRCANKNLYLGPQQVLAHIIN